jgi:DNA-binding CsgD family transcriptional regulator
MQDLFAPGPGPEPAPDLAPALRQVAEAALRGSGMDAVGLYLMGPDERMRGVILGMPGSFVTAYETQGIPIDPVLARSRQTGAPTSTLVALGARWTECHLYLRVSGRFGLTGFATFPLHHEDRLAGVLYLGALTEANARRLDHEGMVAMTPHAIRTATRLMALPHRAPRLTPRQNDVARLAAEGLTNRQIAAALGTGEAAVHKHLKDLHRLFGSHTRTALAVAWRAASGG